MQTTQVTSIAHLLDLTAYAGDHVEDFDMDAVHADLLEAVNANVYSGITVLANGDVVAEIQMAGIAREMDWKSLIDAIDVEPIFERHDKS